MGEILRAVMDEASIFKMPAFYAISVPIPNPLPPAGSFLTGVLQGKNDRWFLITSLFAALDAGPGAPIPGPATSLALALCSIFDVSSSRVYWSAVGDGDLLGGSVNAAFTLPEYILLEPDQIIGFRISIDQMAVNPGFDTVRMQMQGIEYIMPGK